ncbi:hypothetical protein [Marispirochaeta sp.]|uniref:hypothetical protein n=1 Tax=Marispirochaeta sp. TaxID=2038653 RepID=UPI0029C67F5B|nr:hypothetical protein [Marispirochaeta sp.]
MIENLDRYLIGVALGIRFRANFTIEDQLGKIVDTILYSSKSYFNPTIFPKVRNLIGKKVLFNEISQDTLQIDNSNIILELNFGDEFSFRQKDLDNILRNFNEQIINGIMKEFSIKEIVRIGYIRRYIFNLKDLAETFVNKTVGDTLEGVNDINLSFSKRIPLSASLTKSDVNDYDNAIFNVIKKADMEEIFMSVDYQSFFDPFLPSSGLVEFKPFIEKANGFNSNKYLTWLNSNYVEVENVK